MAFFASIPPLAIAGVAVLVYAWLAAGRWSWSMAPDTVLLAFYLWRPSIGCLAFMVFVCVLRHVPRLSREFARMFMLDGHIGMTRSVINYLLPSLLSPDNEPTLMVSSGAYEARESAGMGSVYIPVSRYGMADAGMASAEPVSPDIDQQNGDQPIMANNLTEMELIAVLSVQRGADGKYRYSANMIHKIVGGDRNKVLQTVREIRVGPPNPIYPPRTPEQDQLRDDLGLT